MDASLVPTERDFAANHSDLPVRVFMGVGRNEGQMVADMDTLAAQLRGRSYPNLALTTQVFEDESHLSVIPFFISRGLRAVFA